LQIACFLLLNEKCDMLVIDAADLLRGESWDGLVKVINQLHSKRQNKHFIVCATDTETPEGWNTIELS